VRNRAVVLIDDVHDGSPAEYASVERLAAGRGIERRPIEHGNRSAIAIVQRADGRVEFT
jgi:hypothetical protein